MKLPANKSLRFRARELRKNSTLSEVILWNHLKRKRANGLDFDRQRVIGNYIVDFYCSKLKLVIEVDGDSHNDKYVYDANRDKYLQSLGLTVLHVEDMDVKFRIDSVIYSIETMIANHYPADKIGTPSPAKGN